MSLLHYVMIGTLLSIAETTLSFDSDTGYFWQITDIHYDANYSTSGLAQYLCHQQPWDSESRDEEKAEHHGIYGDYDCDSPWSLVTSAVRAMKQLAPEVDFILWTGDSIPHVPDTLLNFGKVFRVVRSVTELLLETFPDTPFYPTIGNHDAWPASQVPPSDSGQYYSNMAQAAGWDKMLDEGSLKTFRKGGYYCTQSPSGLWMIGLNTELWYRFDNLVANMTDPADQMKWLETQLLTLRKKKAKALLSGHVPPGSEPKGETINWYYAHFNSKFLELIQKYPDVIVALIFAHEHKDNLHIVYDTKGSPILPMYMAPAVTPMNSTLPEVGANNPGIRLYKYSRKTGHVLDLTQFYINLPDANRQQRADWTMEYTATKAYGIPDIGAASLDSLVQTFKEPDSKNFEKYYMFTTANCSVTPPCTGNCKRQHICAITTIDYEQFEKCIQGRELLAGNNTRHGVLLHSFQEEPAESDHSLTDHKNNGHLILQYILPSMSSVVLVLSIVLITVYVSKRLPPRGYERIPD